MLPVFLVFAMPERPVVEIAVTGESKLIQSEFTHGWEPRRPEDAELCDKWRTRRDAVRYRFDLRFIDEYDIEHPGYPAIRYFKTQKWRPLPRDYWLFTTAPIQWMEYEAECWRVAYEPDTSRMAWIDEEWSSQDYIKKPWVPGNPHEVHVPKERPSYFDDY